MLYFFLYIKFIFIAKFYKQEYPMNQYLILGLCFYFLPYSFYLAVSHGLGHKAEYLQLRRFIPCAFAYV